MHENKNNRWNEWNYSCDGFYFVTICTNGKYPYFGNIENDKMILNDIGAIVKKYWYKINNHFKYVKLHEFVIMPNHVHGIIQIDYNNVGAMDNDMGVMDNDVGAVCNDVGAICNDVGARYIWHLRGRNNQILSLVIGLFKSACTRNINKIKPYFFKWQKSFHDHIIRNNNEYLRIKYYIKNNPKMWNRDRNNK